MKELFKKIHPHSAKLFALFLVLFALFLAYVLFQAPVDGFEEKLKYLLEKHGYIILFVWGMLEGETGLVMAGLLAHSDMMNLYLAIFVGGLGGFAGDQIYFYLGRFNKHTVHTKFRGQRRKFAFAHLLLKKHGWPIIFFQRYMYGMRTIIPISIGLTRYDARKFAFINLISAWCWAAITILPVWYLGDQIMVILHWTKDYWYMAIPLFAIVAGSVIYYFNKATKKMEKRMMNEN